MSQKSTRKIKKNELGKNPALPKNPYDELMNFIKEKDIALRTELSGSIKDIVDLLHKNHDTQDKRITQIEGNIQEIEEWAKNVNTTFKRITNPEPENQEQPQQAPNTKQGEMGNMIIELTKIANQVLNPPEPSLESRFGEAALENQKLINAYISKKMVGEVTGEKISE
jgi:uncharacterized membrane-anchored protein YjiN (DUF445 family)